MNHLDIVQKISALEWENAGLREQLRKLQTIIPMDFLQATQRNGQIDLEAAIRLVVQKGREREQEIRALKSQSEAA